VLQVVRLFERDADRVDDCFVFTCERLRRDDLRRLRRFRAAGTASFATWLRAVVRNLCLDWRRARFGRPRLPRAIARLPRLDQEVFRALYHRGLSENETIHALRPVCPGISRARLDESLTRIRATLDARQNWSLLVRRPRTESLSGATDERAGPETIDLPDPRPGPADEAELCDALAAVRAVLARRLPRERLLVRLRYEQELSVEEISRLPGLGSPAAIEQALAEALESLHAELAAAGAHSLSVKGR
jgi:RNA polymerase sigma factor (sigma-70 family)